MLFDGFPRINGNLKTVCEYSDLIIQRSEFFNFTYEKYEIKHKKVIDL